MNARDEHLTSDQIEGLLAEMQDLQSGEPRSRSARIDQSHREHLAACALCQERLHMFGSIDQELAELRLDAPAPRGIDCPPEMVWMRIAAGLETGPAPQKLLQHAAHCDYCGALLRQATEDFADELTPHENERLAGLQSASGIWQRSLGKNARGSPAGSFAKPSWFGLIARSLRGWPPWLYAAGTAVLLAALGAGVWICFYPPAWRAERLLADAYTQQRSMELRIPGARYAPMRVERGAERSRLSRPRPLLDAEALIARRLATHPNDPDWLAAAGRAELLEWQYDSAIENFSKALETQPASTSLLTGLATAYFQRGQVQDRAQDYARAIDLLGQALSHQPADPVALFNRAILNERLFLYHRALDDWESFLRLDPYDEWAEEARQRRETLLDKIKAHEHPKVGAIRDPGAAAIVLRQRAATRSSSEDWPGSLDEAYLDIATNQWLPLSDPSSVSAASGTKPSQEQEALAALAAVLRRYHGDEWLSDLLQQHWRHPSLGIQELAAAVHSNAQGNAEQSSSFALRAGNDFHSSGVVSGALRAQLEYVAALRSAQKGSDCLEAALDLLHQLRKYRYPWIQANALLEASTCYGLVGNVGMAQELAHQAVDFAHGTGYQFQYLLSLYYDDGVSVAASEVSSPQAWSRVRSVLRQSWEAPDQPQIAGGFYPDLNHLAEAAQFWHLAELVGREIVTQTPQGEDRTYEAIAHHWLAQDLQMAGDFAESETELALASRLFASLPPTPAARSSWAAMEIYRASLEIQLGHTDAATARLSRVRSILPELTNSDFFRMYYQCLGELYLHSGNLRAAERAFHTVVRLSELSLTSLPAELDRLTWERESGQTYRHLTELYFHRYHDPVKALDFWEWYRAAALRARVSATPARIDSSILDADPGLPAMPSVQSFLPSLSNQTILSFASFRDGLAVWAYDNRGIKTAWLPVSAGDLDQVAQRFARLCADPSSDLLLLRRDGRQLYDWLIGPVAANLDPARQLIVEPDGALNQIPLRALVDFHGDYLDQHFSVVISPGLGYFQLLRPPPRFSKQQQMLAVGAPLLPSRVADDFPPLPDADLEARTVAAKFDRTLLLVNRQATLERVASELARAELFHFAGHALSGGTHPGLLLSAASPDPTDDSPLPLLDANSLTASQTALLQLVVLAACQTATAENELVDPDSLVRAFLRGGVPHVLATRWRVDSRVTAEMVETFYSNLLDGTPVADALRTAAQRVRSQPLTSHPYFWADFSAFGR